MYRITIQRAVSSKTIPSSPKLKKWAQAVLAEKMPKAELTIRIVDEAEITELNSAYRKKNKPTNVLSFPSDIPAEFNDGILLLGDIVICAAVISQEAKEQNKSEESHWAHMVVHGALHLLGYDHEKDDEAIIMEAEEIKILNTLGFDNPYYIKG